MIKIYCDICKKHVNIFIEPVTRENYNVFWGDIVCPECNYIIATLTTDKPGTYRITGPEPQEAKDE